MHRESENIKKFIKIKPAVIKQIPLVIRLDSEKLQNRILLDSPPGWTDLSSKFDVLALLNDPKKIRIFKRKNDF